MNMFFDFETWLMPAIILIVILIIILKIKFGVRSGSNVGMESSTPTSRGAGGGIFGRLNGWLANLKKTAEEAKQDVENQFNAYISSQQLRFSNVPNQLMLEGSVENVDTKITFYPVGVVGSKKKPYQGVALWNVQLKLPSASKDKKDQIVTTLKEIAAPHKGTVQKIGDMVTVTFSMNEITGRPITIFEKLKAAFSLR